MVIEKAARDAGHFHREMRAFDSARAAFRAYLAALDFGPNDEVLLPAFIGWSSREGSGVFDPIAQLQLRYAFYRVDDRLRIDIDDLGQRLRRGATKLVVLIHYFGYVDPNYREAARLARNHGALVLEDEAHAMLTDFVGGVSGRLGDACIFSFHKMLPVPSGGALLVNPGAQRAFNAETAVDAHAPWDYDLHEIARRRRRNAELIHARISRLSPTIEPLWGVPNQGEIPQTYPVIVKGVSRDELYVAMNDAGYGVVSLYHTMVEPIDRESFPSSHALASRIMNLPVHQDVEPDDIESMIDALQASIETATAGKG